MLQSPGHYRPVIQYARYSSRPVTPACQSLHQLASRYSRSLRSLRSALQTFLSLRDSRCDMYACVTALLQYEVRPTKVRWLHIINTTRRSERGSREEIGIAKFKHQFKSTCEESYYMLEGYCSEHSGAMLKFGFRLQLLLLLLLMLLLGPKMVGF